MEAAEAAALMVGRRGRQRTAGRRPQAAVPALLYGELVPLAQGGVRCTVASAGHPLPLLLRPDGTVRTAAEPQMLLGIVEDVAYQSQTFDLAPGDTLLCVTDGVTERRSGPRMFDDGDGLARVLAGCAGLAAQGSRSGSGRRCTTSRSAAGGRSGAAGAAGAVAGRGPASGCPGEVPGRVPR